MTKGLSRVFVWLILPICAVTVWAIARHPVQAEMSCVQYGRIGWNHVQLEDDYCCAGLQKLSLATPTGRWKSCVVEDHWVDAFVCSQCGDGICSDGENVCNCKKDCKPAKTCGNKRLDIGESCDDGNRKNGDGCNERCVTEEGWTCRGSPSTCKSRCGDGVETGKEQCDDGNLRNGDGCSVFCQWE